MFKLRLDRLRSFGKLGWFIFQQSWKWRGGIWLGFWQQFWQRWCKQTITLITKKMKMWNWWKFMTEQAKVQTFYAKTWKCKLGLDEKVYPHARRFRWLSNNCKELIDGTWLSHTRNHSELVKLQWLEHLWLWKKIGSMQEWHTFIMGKEFVWQHFSFHTASTTTDFTAWSDTTTRMA